jgi:hypothetical protein
LCDQKPGFWYAEWNHAQSHVEPSEACIGFHAASGVHYIEHIYGNEALAWWARRSTESDDDDGDACYEATTTDIDWCIAAILLVVELTMTRLCDLGYYATPIIGPLLMYVDALAVSYLALFPERL